MVLKDGARAAPEELRAFLAEIRELAAPRRVRLREANPAHLGGKFQKIKLREQFANWKWES